VNLVVRAQQPDHPSELVTLRGVAVGYGLFISLFEIMAELPAGVRAYSVGREMGLEE
jgi:hypothetical protein